MPACYSYNGQLEGVMHNCPFEEMYMTDWNQQVAGLEIDFESNISLTKTTVICFPFPSIQALFSFPSIQAISFPERSIACICWYVSF